MRREDLRVLLPPPAWDTLLLSPQRTRHVEAAELAELIESMGYVKVPDCEECRGSGVSGSYLDLTYVGGGLPPCPSCGGTGKQRMMAVGGIDWEQVRKAWLYGVHRPDRAERESAQDIVTDALKMIFDGLAALEGEPE